MRILFLQKRVLFPADVGCKIRTLNVLRYLARWHEITYLCNLQPGEEEYAAQMYDLGLRVETVPWRETPRDSVRFYVDLAGNLLSPFPFNVDKDFDQALRTRAAAILATEPYDLLICDFVQMARNALGLKGPATLLFEHNVEAEVFQRQAETNTSLWQRLYLKHQWRKMRQFEAKAGKRFDAVIAVSRRDRHTFVSDYGWQRVHVIDTAVDVNFFKPDGVVEGGDRVVFVGSLDWPPNQDGARHFVEDIWPEIRRRRPTATFQIVGRNPSAAVRQLSRTPGVEVVGTVPDIRPYLAQASVVVVPLRTGGGTRLKIYEAMAMRKAVVSTALGAEGLGVAAGEHLLIADTPRDFAVATLELLDNPERRETLARSAHQLVVGKYSAEAVARQFEAICLRTVAASSHPTHSTIPQALGLR